MLSGDAKENSAAPRELLKEAFNRNGYVRYQNEERRTEEGRLFYKKGCEVRLVARSDAEREDLMTALEALGFWPGNPFRKGRRWIVPLYGRAEVEWFLRLVEADLLAERLPAMPSRRRQAQHPSAGEANAEK